MFRQAALPGRVVVRHGALPVLVGTCRRRRPGRHIQVINIVIVTLGKHSITGPLHGSRPATIICAHIHRLERPMQLTEADLAAWPRRQRAAW